MDNDVCLTRPQCLALVSLAEQRGVPCGANSRCHPVERSNVVFAATFREHSFERPTARVRTTPTRRHQISSSESSHTETKSLMRAFEEKNSLARALGLPGCSAPSLGMVAIS